MKKFQDIILDEIYIGVKKYDLELVVNYSASNTGVAYVVDGIKTILYFRFNFQTEYCSISIYDEIMEKLKDYPYLEYRKEDKLNELITYIENYAREYHIEKQPMEMD